MVVLLRARLAAPRWFRQAYRLTRSLVPGPVSKALPPALVEQCRCCATRYHLLRLLPKDGVVAELGTLHGDFARQIFNRAKPRELHLIDVDFSRFDDSGLPPAKVWRHLGRCHEIMADFPDEHFDWVYLDADHSYEATLRDAFAAAPKIRPGGYMVFNDFAHIDRELGRYGVHRAVCDFVNEQEWPVAFFAFNPSALYDIALQRPEEQADGPAASKDTAMRPLRSLKVCLVVGIIALLTSSASFAGEWAGKYMTEDTKGHAFAITLSPDGAAAGSKDGHDLSGTWTEDGDAAVIKWTTGWTTKISKDGDDYKKTAYRPGASMDDRVPGPAGVQKVE